MNDLTKLSLLMVVLVLLAFPVGLLLRRFRGRGPLVKTPAPSLYPPRGATSYLQFRNEYIDSAGNFGAWHDGLDHRLFEQMSPDDRERAENDMLKALPDWRCIIGLGFIRSQKAIDPLRRLEKQLHGEQLVRVEQALLRIGVPGEGVPGAKTRQVLAGEDSGSNKISRMDAAMALREFPSAETAAVLRQAVQDDDDYLVRYHAANSLLLIYGYTNEEADVFIRQLAPKLGYQKAQAFPEALARIDGLIAGRSIVPPTDGEQ